MLDIPMYTYGHVKFALNHADDDVSPCKSVLKSSFARFSYVPLIRLLKQSDSSHIL